MTAIRDLQRLLLATIASEGILGHNSAVSMPEAFGEDRLLELLPDYPRDQLRLDLDELTSLDLLRFWNTGHSGYGNSWIKGIDTWQITAKGLITLWGSIAI